VEVEVVLGEVGEDGHVELDAVHARQREGVGGHLHGRAANPRLHHARQQGLELERLGRGLARGLGLVAHPVLDGADHAGRPAARAEQGLHQERRGGLAVRAGDADHREAPRRVAVIGVGEPRQGLPR
jgi:hypothetical protein